MHLETMTFEIKRYNGEKNLEEWNLFVKNSKQGTFLLDRLYMDYHSDRFTDHSLMIYKNDKLYALLPGNEADGIFYSHQGLTYGGLLTTSKTSAEEVCKIFVALNAYLRAEGFQKVIYKAIPWIYQQIPAEEDLYAIVKECHAQLIVRNIASVVDMSHPLKWNRDRHYGANKAHTDGIIAEESNDFPTFWKILEDNLMATYQAKPVHTLKEILLLKSRFPELIRLYVAKKEGKILGGTLLYITPQVVHAQYISATAEGKHAHAIDAIFRKVLKDDFKDCRYFDFGTSNEDHGKVLNTSLIYQKEGFGGRAVVYDTYEWKISCLAP